ncbi:MAG: hypothetical protein EOO38_18785 [Cytophagaceae bacterium]|nr:MAG: hypothetical protein EOO38_18785 [Cytophagaceae bacterium]
MKPNNDKPPLTPSLERSLDPLHPGKAVRTMSKFLRCAVYFYVGFMVLIALNYAWLGYARAHGYYSQQAKTGVHKSGQ